jgi:hypothetical protein
MAKRKQGKQHPTFNLQHSGNIQVPNFNPSLRPATMGEHLIQTRGVLPDSWRQILPKRSRRSFFMVIQRQGGKFLYVEI